VTLAGQNRIVVRHKISIIQTLPVSYQQRIARIPGVEAVTHQTWFGGNYQEPKNFFPKIPVVPGEFLELFPEYSLDPEAVARWNTTRTGAIVGRKLARKYGFNVGDRLPIIPNIWMNKSGSAVWEFDIVGIYDGTEKNTDTSQMFFRYDYFDESRAGGTGEVGWYTVRITDPDAAVEIAAAIDDEFANSPAETKAEAEGAFLTAFAKQIGNITAIMISILGAVFFTILLVAGNTMAQSIRERTSEIATLKALGFSNPQILRIVLTESLLISCIGGIAGLGLAWALISAGIPTLSALPVFFIPPTNLAIGFGLAVVLGLLTGILPAWQAARLRIASALRRN